MRKLLILATAAPLALLAACGDSDVDETEMAATEEPAAIETAMPDDADATATSLAEAGDYSGTYTYADSAGGSNSLTLDSNAKTYSYTGADGTTKTGSYTVADDGFRLTIADMYPRPRYYIYTGDSVYLLPEDDTTDYTADTTITVTGDRYMRDMMGDEPGGQVAPGASVNSVQDKRN